MQTFSKNSFQHFFTRPVDKYPNLLFINNFSGIRKNQKKLTFLLPE